MRSPNKKSAAAQGMTLMLLSNPGGKVRRFQLRQRHIVAVGCVWLLALAVCFSFGFYG